MLEGEAQMRQRRGPRMLAEDISELIVLGCSKHGKSALEMLAAWQDVAAPDQR